MICSALCTFCGAGAPRPAPLGRPLQNTTATSSGTAPSAVSVVPAVSPEASNSAFCISLGDASQLVVATLDGRSVTQCEVQLLAVWAVREGLGVPSEEQRIAQWIALELQALEAQRRGLTQDAITQGQVRQILGSGVVRAEARRLFQPPTSEQISRYYESHRDDFTQDTRVHVRAIGLRTERAAHQMLNQLTASHGENFVTLALEHSAIPNARRDAGDLGLLSTTVASSVPTQVIEAAFALQNHGEIADHPIRVTFVEPARPARRGRRHRPARPRSVSQWWIVQRLERIESTVLPLNDVTRRIASKLGQEQWLSLLAQARTSLLAQARTAVATTINDEALRLVRIRPANAPHTQTSP